jgi:hypothetical protein
MYGLWYSWRDTEHFAKKMKAMKEEGFRARHHAVRESSGDQTVNPLEGKGVIAMARQLIGKTGSNCPSVLVMIGWLAFIVGLIVKPVGLKTMLVSFARALPEVLRL